MRLLIIALALLVTCLQGSAMGGPHAYGGYSLQSGCITYPAAGIGCLYGGCGNRLCHGFPGCAVYDRFYFASQIVYVPPVMFPNAPVYYPAPAVLQLPVIIGCGLTEPS